MRPVTCLRSAVTMNTRLVQNNPGGPRYVTSRFARRFLSALRVYIQLAVYCHIGLGSGRCKSALTVGFPDPKWPPRQLRRTGLGAKSGPRVIGTLTTRRADRAQPHFRVTADQDILKTL